MSEKSSPSATHSPRRKSLALAAAAALALGLPLAGTAGAAAAVKPGPVAVAGTAPSWAVASHAVGAASAGAILNLSVRLRVDTAGARAYAAAVSKPGSRVQGRFLSPRAWTARFGASPAEAAGVAAFLRAQGFTHVAVNASRTAVAARGSVGLAQRAFGVKVERYTVAGQTLRAPDRNVRVPANIAHAVTAVVGLAQTPLRPQSVRLSRAEHAVSTAARAAAGSTAPLVSAPCSSYYGQYEVSGLPVAFGQTTLPTVICNGYTPKQIESAYGLSTPIAKGTTGRGVKVAIIDAYRLPSMATDLARYSRDYGLPVPASGQYSENVPSFYDSQDACGADGWNAEEALDVDSVHTTAPGASIVYVAASDCGAGIDQAFDRLLAGNGTAPLASIVSNSYSNSGEDLPAAQIQAETLQYLQAAAEGVSVVFATGDAGDEAANNAGIAEPTFPAVSPWVTGVGGTSLGIAKTGRKIFQTGWETSANLLTQDADGTLGWLDPLPGEQVYGAGGGTSATFAEPGYQRGVVSDALAYARGNGRPGRVVPDLSALGDPFTGFRIAYSAPGASGPVYTEFSYGGTSVASPMTAGMVALAQQWNARPFGFLNPALYALHTTSAVADVKPPNPNGYPSQQAVIYQDPSGDTLLIGLDKASTLLTARGYDDVTGLGSPNGIYFLTNLARVLK